LVEVALTVVVMVIQDLFVIAANQRQRSFWSEIILFYAPYSIQLYLPIDKK
jgi:hypothetical protein